jgi:hypothetical protein
MDFDDTRNNFLSEPFFSVRHGMASLKTIPAFRFALNSTSLSRG